MGNLKMDTRIWSKVLKGKKNLINLDAHISTIFKKIYLTGTIGREEWI